MEIRRATHADTERINALLRQVLEVHHGIRPDLFRANAKKYTDEELSAILSDEEKPIFVATREGEVLGYAFCYFVQHKENNILTDVKSLYIDDLCVDESARGAHIGSALYEYVVSFAREQGCYNLTLNVWAGNEGALRFYQSKGLVPQKIYMEQLLQAPLSLITSAPSANGGLMKTLIVIDMQNDFIDGSLSNPDAQAIVGRVVELVSAWQGEIVLTRDTHGENYLSTEEGRHLPIPHCIKESEGWQIRKEIEAAARANPHATVKVVDKPSFGAGTLLYEAVIADRIPQEVTFCGTCTDICVVSNALILKSLLPETPMRVRADACAGLTREKHEAALEVLRSCQFDVVTE